MPTRHMNPMLALIKAIRLKQAPKNLFVFAALVFADKLFNVRMFAQTVAAFLLFTVAAGSIYLLNDIIDVEQDRRHPRKRNRPIASGALSIRLAWFAMAVMMAGSLAASFALRPKFGIVVAVYLLLQVAYCLKLKQLVLLDVFTVAAGFLLRAIAGGFVINVFISPWLLLCTLQLALFLGFGKRRQELVLLGDNADKHRAILDEYSVPFLDQMITLVTAGAIVCYSVYSVQSLTAIKHPHLWITVPIVIYSVFRYLYLVYQKGWGGAPEEVLLQDRQLQASIIFWFLTVTAIFAFDRADRSLFRFLSGG